MSDPCNASYLRYSSKEIGYTIRSGEKAKVSHWKQRANDAGIPGITVIPIVFETSGRIGEIFRDFIKHVVQQTGTGPKQDKLWDQLSVTLQRGNVAMIDEAVRKSYGHKSRTCHWNDN